MYLILPFFLFSCGNTTTPTSTSAVSSLSNSEVSPVDSDVTESAAVSSPADDESAIKQLIQDVYQWQSQLDDGLPGFVPVYDDQGQAIGMDESAMENALDKMKSSDLFDTEFLAQYTGLYDRIVADLKSGETAWEENGYLPYFGADPWCNCQDIPYTEPDAHKNYWEKFHVVVENILEKNAGVRWYWDKNDAGNIDDAYNMTVIKSDGKWRVGYMDGFASLY